MLTVYIGAPREGMGFIGLLHPNFHKTHASSPFGEPTYVDLLVEKIVEVVARPEEADVLLLPHNYFQVRGVPGYIEQFRSLAKQYSKKIIIFAEGDRLDAIDIPEAIIFRNSLYRSKKKSNEHVIPAFIYDLGALYGNEPKAKGVKPVVSFAGWAREHGRARLVHAIKNFLLRPAEKKGIYWRRKAIDALLSDSGIETRFHIRDSFGGNVKTIQGDPREQRREFIESIKNSDFVLAPKGDGNFSLRMYEALALGRIPIIIDTDVCLPLEGHINYSSSLVRVAMSDVPRIGEIVKKWFNSKDEQAWHDAQTSARELYQLHLRPDIFLRTLMTKEFLHLDRLAKIG